MIYGLNVKPVYGYYVDVDVLDGTLDRVELIGPTPRWRINDDEALELAA